MDNHVYHLAQVNIMNATAVNPDKVRAIYEREQQRFHQQRPVSAALLERAKQHMPNGVPCAWMDGLYFHQPVLPSAARGPIFGTWMTINTWT